MNYSTCKFLVRNVLGPTAQVKTREGVVQIFVHTGDVRTVYGEGLSFIEAFRDAFADWFEPIVPAGEFPKDNPVDAGTQETAASNGG